MSLCPAPNRSKSAPIVISFCPIYCPMAHGPSGSVVAAFGCQRRASPRKRKPTTASNAALVSRLCYPPVSAPRQTVRIAPSHFTRPFPRAVGFLNIASTAERITTRAIAFVTDAVNVASSAAARSHRSAATQFPNNIIPANLGTTRQSAPPSSENIPNIWFPLRPRRPDRLGRRG